MGKLPRTGRTCAANRRRRLVHVQIVGPSLRQAGRCAGRERVSGTLDDAIAKWLTDCLASWLYCVVVIVCI